MRVESYACGRWVPPGEAVTPLLHAVTGEPVAEVGTTNLDFAAVLRYAREVGGPRLRRMTFHERAAMLRKLALHLTAEKEKFYECSWPTGATRKDAWIDIEGGIGTLFTYVSKARRELPNEPFYIDGAQERLSKNGTFVGQHICVPLEGTALHINAFNFPCWGMLEKLAPTLLAGVPAIIKPATATCYLTETMVRSIVSAGILPEGSLQLLCGGIGDLFNHLTCQDVVTLTGSKETGSTLKQHPAIFESSVRFNLEADSLNCSVLGPDATPGTPEYDLFLTEVVREMTVKAGQKCTAIRRVLVPERIIEDLSAALKERLCKVTVGNPQSKGVQMGPLVSKAQLADVRERIGQIANDATLISGSLESFDVIGATYAKGAFLPPALLRCDHPSANSSVHSLEAFGPVSTLIPYATLDSAITYARSGAGSLVASVFSNDDDTVKTIALGLAPFHGRLMLINRESAGESTGHGSPMPHMIHGGPGRAGGGEELGGIRSVLHYMQRTALQGSPQTLTRICNVFQRGAKPMLSAAHPFRKYFDELVVGETFFTPERTITEKDVAAFADLSGDRFYVHTDAEAAKQSQFGEQIAHGYLILSAAAGLFVDPAPGPVIANYGLEKLRFIKPVHFNDKIKARLTCKQKVPKADEPHGVVHWDVEVTNQSNETVAVYTVLTLVKTQTPASN